MNRRAAHRQGQGRGQSIPASAVAQWARQNPLDAAALATAPIPIVGDVVGGAADVKGLLDNPSWMNAGMLAAGMLPFIPAGTVRNIDGMLRGPKLTKEQYDLAAKTGKARKKLGTEKRAIADEARSQIEPVQQARREARQGYDPLTLDLSTRKMRAKYAQERARAEALIDQGDGIWSKSFADEVRVTRNTSRANMEAVPRLLKKEGWSVRHASKGRDGRKSSRYLVSPDGRLEVRLSDHQLPATPQREMNTRGPRWDYEIVLTGKEAPQDVLEEIKSIYDESGS